MTIKSFRDLDIWIESKALSIKIFEITGSVSFRLDLRFKDQIRSSAISVPSNIAEGFERDNNNEFIHFLKISKGSCAELITQSEIAVEIGFLEKDETNYLIKRYEVLNARIGRFINYLENNRLTRKLANKQTR